MPREEAKVLALWTCQLSNKAWRRCDKYHSVLVIFVTARASSGEGEFAQTVGRLLPTSGFASSALASN